MQSSSRFGIYFNQRENVVVRINSPYWIPEGPDWIHLTPEVNATLLQIRGITTERKLLADASGLNWGSIPLKD